MPRAVPTLGYPTRREAFIALSREGLSSREIARRVNAADPDAGVNAQVVSKYLSEIRARRSGTLPLTLNLRGDDYAALQAAAVERSTRADALARRIVLAALQEKLIDAILDDGDDD